MKKLNRKTRLNISITIFIFFSVWSCNKSSNTGIDAQTSTLTYVLAHGSTTTIFNSAVVKAGLDSTFNGNSIFTLFVPNDQACNQSGYSQSVVSAFSRDQARKWVLYQTYAGSALSLESFIGLSEKKLLMADGDSIFITGDSNRTFVNGTQLINSELKSSNGLMLALRYVLLPPKQNLDQMVGTDTSLTFFNAAIQSATSTPENLNTMLSTSGIYTLLAPDNDAFRNLGYNSPADVSQVNPDSLRSSVLLHMIPQRLFSYDVSDSSQFKTANDSTLIFLLTGINAKVKVIGSAFSSNVIAINGMAINGVLFKIDELLDR